MSIKSLVALGSVLVAVSAFAQAPLGTVGNVQGLVTITDGATGSTVVTGSPITNGMRFVATSGGSAVLRLNNGCVLTLQPGQAVTVLQNMTCQQLTAAVQQAGGVTVAGAGGSGGTGALAAGGLAAGVLVLNKTLVKNDSISGN
jgi:hypothetical protein